MKLWHAICGAAAILALLPAGALAQEDPEAVYARLHRASLAGNSAEVLSFATARQNADLASKSKAEKDAVIQFMAKLMPKTYSITGKTIAPDGNSAVLRGTGIGEFMGKSQMYLTANFVKEAGTWKVDQWGWTSDKPAAPAKPEPKPEAKMAELKPEPKAAPKPAPAPAKMEKEAVQQSETRPPASAAGTNKPSRANEDARECLKLSTDSEIMKCAGKFR
jgi:hypothetical protein